MAYGFGNMKITEELKEKVRKVYMENDLKPSQLALRFQVHHSTIIKILGPLYDKNRGKI